MKIRNFRDLDIWQLGKKLVLEIYQVTKSFPKEEQFGIVAQMRRAAISISCNIAEGFNRLHNKELEFGTFSGFWAVFSGSSRRESNFVVSKTCFCDPRDFSDDKFENLPNSSIFSEI